jgi:hypothetical protein
MMFGPHDVDALFWKEDCSGTEGRRDGGRQVDSYY